MAALGFNLNIDAFTSLLNQVCHFLVFSRFVDLRFSLLNFFYVKGPHLLAPTGSDLTKHGSIGTVLAGYHYDFNFLTIHGQSRFPGLSIWLKDGKKVNVKVPSGCLLLQAGKEVNLKEILFKLSMAKRISLFLLLLFGFLELSWNG